jgi:hypothetical protein
MNMKLETVEIYSEASNNTVLKLNDRHFPGSLIQGDSLSILVAEIAEAKTEIELGNSEEAKEILSLVLERLVDRLNIYTEALKAHNLELPFTENKA